MNTFDRMDSRILEELQLDGRISNQDLADRIGMSPSSCLRRTRVLERSGVISGYAAVVNPASVGLGLIAFVRLRLKSHDGGTVERVEDELRSIPEIVEAYLLAGDDDYLLRVVASSFDHYETVLRERLRKIPALASITTTFAMGVTKPAAPIPIGERR
jgi:DNA-binding Lrp family transcriptional regulator